MDMESFWLWWQTLPQRVDPVLLQWGGFKIQYYGLMYIVGFALTYFLVLRRIRSEPRFAVSTAQIQDLMTAMILGLLIGARLGYVFFYNPAYYLQHPLEIVLPFTFGGDGFQFTGIAGMSFHGGLLGVLLALGLVLRKHELDFWLMVDLFAPAVPLGYTFGRLGNFINGELYGRVTQSPLGMVFPGAPDPRLRHPSQLYEALFEGVVLFAVLWSLRRKPLPRGSMLALYLMGYGAVRWGIEFFRQPDAHIGLVAWGLSMGQLLCSAMFLAGLGLAAFLYRRSEKTRHGNRR